MQSHNPSRFPSSLAFSGRSSQHSLDSYKTPK